MPGADEKVVLTIKLESKSLSNEFKLLSRELAKLRSELGTLTQTSTRGYAAQTKEIKAVNSAVREGMQAVQQAEAGKQAAIKHTNDALQKQNEEIKKTESALKRFAKGLGMGSGVSGAFARPEGGYAQRAGQILGSAPRVAMNTGLSAIGGLLGFALGGAQTGYQTYVALGQARFGMTGMGRAAEHTRGLQGAGVRLGFGPIESAAHGAAVGRATGQLSAVGTAQQLALAGGGMDVGQAISIMGALRSAGVEFGMENVGGTGKRARYEQKGSKELEKLIASGMSTGLEKARLPDYLQNVAQVSQIVGTRMVGKVGLTDITRGFGMMAKMPGMNDPMRAMALAQQIDQGIRAPGGGEAGQALIMQAFGFGKPGGQATYYDAQKRQQRGFFGSGGAANAMDVLDEITRQYGQVGVGGKAAGMQEANLVAAQTMGLTLDQVEELQEINNTGKTQEEKLKMIEDVMKKNKPLAEQALAETKTGFSGVKIRLAGIEAKSAVIGARVAPALEAIQDVQMDAMMALFKELGPYIKEVPGLLKQLIGGFKSKYGAMFGKGVDEARQKWEEAEKEINKGRTAWYEKWGGKKAPKTAQEALMAQRDKAAEEARKNAILAGRQAEEEEGLGSALARGAFRVIPNIFGSRGENWAEVAVMGPEGKGKLGLGTPQADALKRMERAQELAAEHARRRGTELVGGEYVETEAVKAARRKVMAGHPGAEEEYAGALSAASRQVREKWEERQERIREARNPQAPEPKSTPGRENLLRQMEHLPPVREGGSTTLPVGGGRVLKIDARLEGGNPGSKRAGEPPRAGED